MNWPTSYACSKTQKADVNKHFGVHQAHKGGAAAIHDQDIHASTYRYDVVKKTTHAEIGKWSKCIPTPFAKSSQCYSLQRWCVVKEATLAVLLPKALLLFPVLRQWMPPMLWTALVVGMLCVPHVRAPLGSMPPQPASHVPHLDQNLPVQGAQMYHPKE